MEKVTCGVYFLFDQGELVYIGQSTNLYMRIGQHIQENQKDFDSFELYPTDSYVALEAGLIEVFHPKYNRQSGCRVGVRHTRNNTTNLTKAIKVIESRRPSLSSHTRDDEDLEHFLSDCCILVNAPKSVYEKDRVAMWAHTRYVLTVRGMYRCYANWLVDQGRETVPAESEFRRLVKRRFGDRCTQKRTSGLVYSCFILKGDAEEKYKSDCP